MVTLEGIYRLRAATAAIYRGEGETQCFQIPEGALLIVNGFHRDGPLVEVVYAGRQLFMFECDLRERAQGVGWHGQHGGAS